MDDTWKHLWEECGKFSGSYECDEYGKVVRAEDAAAFADALELATHKPLPKAKRGATLFREDMTPQQIRRANASLDIGFALEFIAFLRKGEFSFFWDN